MNKVSIDKTVKEVLRLKKQSSKLDELVTTYENRVYEKLSEIDENITTCESEVREIQKGMSTDVISVDETNEGEDVQNYWNEVRSKQSQLENLKNSKHKLESNLTKLRELSSSTWLKYQSNKNALEAIIRTQKTVK